VDETREAAEDHAARQRIYALAQYQELLASRLMRRAGELSTLTREAAHDREHLA